MFFKNLISKYVYPSDSIIFFYDKWNDYCVLYKYKILD